MSEILCKECGCPYDLHYHTCSHFEPPQEDIPDDLKADTELPLDVHGALTSIRSSAINSMEVSRRTVNAVQRLLLALEGNDEEEHWPYGTAIQINFPHPETRAEQWVLSRVADTRPGLVKFEMQYETPSSKAWVSRDLCRRAVFEPFKNEVHRLGDEEGV